MLVLIIWQRILRRTAMRVFLSWSGKCSHEMALALRKWLPTVIPGAEMWVSSKDIGAGQLWADSLFKELNQCDLGILCLTKDRLKSKWSQWMLFEAGATAISIKKKILIPYCLDLSIDELTEGPLSLYQAKKADKLGTREMLEALCRATKKSNLTMVMQLFENQWPRLSKKLNSIKFRNPSSYELLNAVFPVGQLGSRLPFQCSQTKAERKGCSPKTIRTYVHSAEVIGIIEILTKLMEFGVSLDLSHFNDRFIEDERLLLIGGSRYNPRTENIVKNLNPIEWKERQKGRHSFFRNVKDKKLIFDCRHGVDGKVTNDSGAIIKISNETPKQDILFLMGIHMHGTLGAIEVALMEDFQKRVLDSGYNSFIQMVKVEVAKDGLTVLKKKFYKESWFYQLNL
ncbi:MAG TPA: hypothetical protein DGG95_09710 [Cytophagales bacterium]|nr:hypothetical protein [Cytophagales bacterium]